MRNAEHSSGGQAGSVHTDCSIGQLDLDNGSVAAPAADVGVAIGHGQTEHVTATSDAG